MTSHEHEDKPALINGSAKADEITLDEVTADFLRETKAEAEAKQREAAEQATMPYLNQQKAALQIFLRQNKLEGQWKLQADGKTLKREA